MLLEWSAVVTGCCHSGHVSAKHSPLAPLLPARVRRNIQTTCHSFVLHIFFFSTSVTTCHSNIHWGFHAQHVERGREDATSVVLNALFVQGKQPVLPWPIQRLNITYRKNSYCSYAPQLPSRRRRNSDLLQHQGVFQQLSPISLPQSPSPATTIGEQTVRP